MACLPGLLQPSPVCIMLALAACSAASDTLRWAVSRSAVPGAAKPLRNGETRNKERSIDVKKIVKVEPGTGQFPGAHGTKGQGSSCKGKKRQKI